MSANHLNHLYEAELTIDSNQVSVLGKENVAVGASDRA